MKASDLYWDRIEELDEQRNRGEAEQDLAYIVLALLPDTTEMSNGAVCDALCVAIDNLVGNNPLLLQKLRDAVEETLNADGEEEEEDE